MTADSQDCLTDDPISLADGPAWPAPSPEDQGRAEIYRLLSLLLDAPPDQALLDVVAKLGAGAVDMPDPSAFSRALAALSEVARETSPDGLSDEFAALFVGAPMARLTPYASYYASGHLFGRSLAELRMDLGRLGVARREEATEPEDHIATLCEVMSGLILGAFDAPPLSPGAQADFFAAHFQPWARRFFADLEADEKSGFYRAVARLGDCFLELETEAFRML